MPASPRTPKKILMVAPELSPLAKVGGLADMVAALSGELAGNGHDVRVILPRYGFLQPQEDWVEHRAPFAINLGGGRTEFGKLWETTLPGTAVRVYLVEYERYFSGSQVYFGYDVDRDFLEERFAFLARASLDLCDFLDWTPDILHAHDWPAALAPVMLNTIAGERLASTASIFTIHNLQHQGYCQRRILDFAGIPASEFRTDSLESYNQVNPLKGALFHATKLTTVSRTYAQEIQTPAFGCGLEEVLRFRAADLIGVRNGIDESVWNPATDALLPATYTADDFTGKGLCRKALRGRCGLYDDETVPIFGVIARLWEQKGLDLLAGIVPRIMDQMKVQLVILGSGDPMLERQFQMLGAHFPGRVGICTGYDERLSHLIEAGSDFFVMPSRFEPCGLNQMYSMRYGTLPIARRTGGLADTIEQYVEGEATGTGFLFDEASYDALYYTMGWACSTFYDRQDEFQQLRRNAMARDFSWGESARAYEDIYDWAIQARKPQPVSV